MIPPPRIAHGNRRAHPGQKEPLGLYGPPDPLIGQCHVAGLTNTLNSDVGLIIPIHSVEVTGGRERSPAQSQSSREQQSQDLNTGAAGLLDRRWEHAGYLGNLLNASHALLMVHTKLHLV